MNVNPSPENLALLLGLSLFLGFAFEEYFGLTSEKLPGGVRTFPLLALTGAGLYLLEPAHAIAFSVGLLILGAWLFAYYRASVAQDASADGTRAGLVVPVSNVLAYLLGPTVLVEAHWVAVGLTVSAVLLLGARERLHQLARQIPAHEITTLGKFLVLIGVILPILPNQPLTSLTGVTPYQVWLAVVVVSTLSYGSYVVQRLISPERGFLLTVVLGGLYSSTATTVTLARRLHETPSSHVEFQAGMVLATALMYLRLTVLFAVFNLSLARGMAPYLLFLFLVGLLLAGLLFWHAALTTPRLQAVMSVNPLELGAALLFATMFALLSLASAWMTKEFGRAGLYGLAAIVGLTDIDPFVLNLAQGGVEDLSLRATMVAVLIATSSNNLLKACYAMALAGVRVNLQALAALGFLAALGLAIAAWVVGPGPT